MKKLALLACLFLMGTGCALGENLPVNYVVLLDLSDRILQPEQVKRDQELIRIVFETFEKKVRGNLIINSKDRFRVVVAPQKSLREPDGLDGLYLDMGQLTFGEKRVQLEKLKQELPDRLARVYASALQGRRKKADFTGSDLWKYANESLPTDLDARYVNTCIVLTDGYFDFEKNPDVRPQGHRYPDSRVLTRLRSQQDWRRTLARADEGLIPIKKPLPRLSIYVAEIQAKNEFYEERELLEAVWTKWLGEMGVRRQECQSREGLSKSADLLRSFLKT